MEDAFGIPGEVFVLTVFQAPEKSSEAGQPHEDGDRDEKVQDRQAGAS
jgi:hypothetical protein